MSRVFDNSQTGVNETNFLTPSSPVYNNLNAWTLASWLYPTAAVPFGIVFVKDAQASYSVYMVSASAQVAVFGTYSITSPDAVFNTPLPLNQWSHVAATFDKSADAKIHLYINGTEVSSYAAPHAAAVGTITNNSANGWMFGNDTFNDGFTGRIAEQAIWNAALTPSQVATLAASTTGASSIQTPNLVGYWHLCGISSPEPDASGYVNTAVLSSNPPVKGPNSPGYNCPYSVQDSRNFGKFPNASRDVNGATTYDVQTSSNSTEPSKDSRTAGAPVTCGTSYPQNSRTPGTFGPGV